MHTIDTIAIVLFILWMFGFIHIIPAIIIVAVLFAIFRRKKIDTTKKGIFNFRRLRWKNEGL
ncbi:MAG: hypothetical protein WCW40_12960 [Bacteroidota bacterium]